MQIGNGAFWLGDCLEVMRYIPDGSVDMVLCDLPYGTTACSWDTIIPFELLWREYWRVCKSNAAVVLTASQPFTSALIMSQIERFKYCWVWEKSKASNFVHAKYQPLKAHEDICVFSRGGSAQGSLSPMNYFPQMMIGKPYNKGKYNKKIAVLSGGQSGADLVNISGDRVPRSVQYFVTAESEGKYHPTQKPVALFEYLIKTYTNPGDLVLDNCAGSGTTAVAAERNGRRWLCIEKEPAYYYGAVGRVWKECQT